MTGQEIVQALQCTSTPGGPTGDCEKCPYWKTEQLTAEQKENLGVDTWTSCDIDKVGTDAANLIERLTAENAALEPEAVETVKLALCAKHMVDLETLNNTPISRLVELAEADKDGRVVVLPCKVYETDGVRVYEHAVRGIIYRTAGGPDFDESTIGKSIFLTREEAERAMEGKRNG
jgi:hypothetical protein|nr:MAG TPA: hypothetical protein [Caudoviricetes sp.]DAQ46264.1 MAG TPA: hypothetical protein [Caudoviricetes sp.]